MLFLFIGGEYQLFLKRAKPASHIYKNGLKKL